MTKACSLLLGIYILAVPTSGWTQAPMPPPPPPVVAPPPAAEESQEDETEETPAPPTPPPPVSPPPPVVPPEATAAEPVTPPKAQAPEITPASDAGRSIDVPVSASGGQAPVADTAAPPQSTTETIIIPPKGPDDGRDSAPQGQGTRKVRATVGVDMRSEAESGSGEPAFIKGHLIHPGTRVLLSRYDHVGMSVGAHIIDNDFYIGVAPGMAFYLDSGIAFAAHVPLKLLAVDSGSIMKGNISYGGLKIRSEDWDEAADFGKLIRFLTFGRKEYNVYFTINTMRPSTIGHGALLNQYQANIDVDRSMTGVIFDAYNRYGGFELQMNDITFSNRILGGLVFLKPLAPFVDGVWGESLSLGAEYVADMDAPRCVRFSGDSTECVQGTGHTAGFDPYSGASLDHTFVRTDEDTGRVAVDSTRVEAAGVSAEFKIYKDDRNLDLKLFVNHHQFLNERGGSGSSAGFLARINAGQSWIHALRLKGEYRTYEDGFLPSYFDSLYEVQKYAYLYRGVDYQVTPTKYQYVFGDPANGFAQRKLGRRSGYNAEASWGLFAGGRSAKKISMGFGLSDTDGPDDTNFYAHIELPALGFLQVFGTFMRNNLASPGDIFADDPISAEDAVVLSGLRFQVLPILFINAHYSRSYKVVRSAGQEYHLGNGTVLNSAGETSTTFPQDRLFENVQTLFVELELGWEFDDDA